MKASAFVPASVPVQALAVRITPELRQALLDAQGSGQQISFRLGAQPPSDHLHAASGPPAVIRIGGQEFPFSTSVPESKAELVQLPGRGSGCMGVGTVVQKLGMQVSEAHDPHCLSGLIDAMQGCCLWRTAAWAHGRSCIRSHDRVPLHDTQRSLDAASAALNRARAAGADAQAKPGRQAVLLDQREASAGVVGTFSMMGG